MRTSCVGQESQRLRAPLKSLLELAPHKRAYIGLVLRHSVLEKQIWTRGRREERETTRDLVLSPEAPPISAADLPFSLPPRLVNSSRSATTFHSPTPPTSAEGDKAYSHLTTHRCPLLPRLPLLDNAGSTYPSQPSSTLTVPDPASYKYTYTLSLFSIERRCVIQIGRAHV